MSNVFLVLKIRGQSGNEAALERNAIIELDGTTKRIVETLDDGEDGRLPGPRSLAPRSTGFFRPRDETNLILR